VYHEKEVNMRKKFIVYLLAAAVLFTSVDFSSLAVEVNEVVSDIVKDTDNVENETEQTKENTERSEDLEASSEEMFERTMEDLSEKEVEEEYSDKENSDYQDINESEENEKTEQKNTMETEVEDETSESIKESEVSSEEMSEEEVEEEYSDKENNDYQDIIETEENDNTEQKSTMETEVEDETEDITEREDYSETDEEVAVESDTVVEGDFTYTISDGTATITDYTGSGGSVVIPSILGGATVTRIGDDAFKGSTITDVVLSDSIIKIGNCAFSDCTLLNSLYLPPNLEHLGYRIIENTQISSIEVPKSLKTCNDDYRDEGPFANCEALKKVVFEEGIEIIPAHVLATGNYDNSCVTELVIPDSVISIDNYAFSGCASLNSLYLPPNLEHLGCRIIENTQISSIEVPKSLKTCNHDYRDEGPFANCKSLKEVKFEEGTEKISEYILAGSNVTDIVIPDSVISLGDFAFSNCTSLSEINLPETIIEFGKGVFSNCTLLEKVVLPNSLTAIGYGAFSGSAIVSINLPNTITSIGNFAFSGCTSLEKVTLPNGLTAIGNGIFADCAIMSINLPNTITSIGDFAFSGCTKLSSLELPTNIKHIGCCIIEETQISEIIIPKSLVTCGTNTYHSDEPYLGPFANCPMLTTVVLEEGIKSVPDNIFLSLNSESYISTVKIPASVNSIGAYAFCGCTRLTSIDLPKNVNGIGNNAFRGCIGLTNIELPENINVIGYSAFRGCEGLISIELPKSIKYIEAYVFYGCSGLTNIKLPENIKEIGECAFYYCSMLTNVELPEGVEKIQDCAFSGCTSMEYLEIPKTVKYLGISVIGYTSISKIKIPSSLEECGNVCGFSFGEYLYVGSFSWCQELTTVEFEEGLKKIPSYILSSGSSETINNIKKVIIPETVTEIGKYAFYNCGNLTDIYYSGDEKQWKEITIGTNNNKLNHVTIHYNSTGPKEGFYFYSATPTTCIKTGESLEFDVQYYKEDKFDSSIENIIYVISDNNVMDVTPGNWSNTKGKHYTVKAKAAGYSTITFTHPDNGEVGALELYVVNGETGYSFDSVPKFTVEKGKTTNFYNYNGMVVDEFKYTPLKDSDGKIVNYNVTMNVYNSLNLYGAVTSYDKNGNLKGYYVIDRMKTQPTNFGDNIKTAVYLIGDLGHLISNGKFYSGLGTSKKTKVEIEVPVGGHLEISNSSLSDVVVLSNMVGGTLDNITAASGYVTGAYDLTDSEAKIIQAVLRDIFSEQHLEEMITKTIKKAAIDELKNGNWNYDNFGECVNAVLDRLTEFGVDLVGIIEKEILSLDSASSISETVIMTCIPTGKLINFMYDALGTVDSLDIWDTFMQSVYFPRGIYIYAPSSNNTLTSNGVNVTSTETSESNMVMHAYLVLDTSEISGSKYQTYNINMYRDGQKIQPNAPVNVQIPIPSGYNKSNIKVYRLNDDGTITDMDATIIDGYASFTTDHFSYYALVSGDKGGVFLEGWKFGETSTITLSDPEAHLKDSIVVYAASYDKNGKMLDIVAGNNFVHDDSELQVTFNHQLTKNWELFILNSTTYAPLCPSITFPEEKD